MIALSNKVVLSIETKDETYEYPLAVRLTSTSSDKEVLKAFQKKKEKEYEDMQNASKRSTKLQRKIERYTQDVEQVEAELKELEQESPKESKKALLTLRKETRKNLRKAEDELEKISLEYDISMYQEKIAELSEAVAKKSFELQVEKSQEREELEELMKELGISYILVLGEVLNLIQKSQEKKSKDS